MTTAKGKAALIAAARAGGAQAVRKIMENGGPRETVTVKCGMSRDLLQYRLTDNNYHSVEIVKCSRGQATLTAPDGYNLELVVTEGLGLEVIA